MRVEIKIFQDSGTLVWQSFSDACQHFSLDLPPGMEVRDPDRMLGLAGFIYDPKVITIARAVVTTELTGLLDDTGANGEPVYRPKLYDGAY